jgi:hypothetical protein
LSVEVEVLTFLQVFFPSMPEVYNHYTQPLNLAIEVVSFCPLRAGDMHIMAAIKVQ